MASVELSVIIPSKNSSHQTAEIIGRITEQTKDIETEYIVVDMDSADKGVLYTLNEIKKRNLKGYVIQSGGSSLASALNTGIFKSNGRFITFIHPERLYKDYLCDYYNTAKRENADLVFSVPYNNSEKAELVSSGLDKTSGAELASRIVRSQISIDFGAVMISRDYLIRKHIKFYEDCSLGYADAFILDVLICHPDIAYADIELCRYSESGTSKDKDGITTKGICFDRVEAMKRVFEHIEAEQKDNDTLKSLFVYYKLPAVVMASVDFLLREGFGFAAIRNSLHMKGYDKLLKISSATPSKLRVKILKWKLTPWLYQP